MRPKRKPLLQVALDLLDLRSALRIARTAQLEGAELLEAGTPLIKSVGIRAVGSLKKRFGKTCRIVADMKTLDAGALEAWIAVEAGADIVTVAGTANRATISAAARVLRGQKAELCVDLIGVNSPLAKAKQAERLGASIVEVHTGIDVQRSAGRKLRANLSIVRSMSESLDVSVAVAGGLDEVSAPLFVEAGADVIIVGGAITGSRNPGLKTRAILEAIRD